MGKIKELIKKYLTKEIILYIILGVCTTVVNFSSFYIMTNFLKWNDNIANFIAIILAVLFAYFSNKDLVFFFDTKQKYCVDTSASHGTSWTISIFVIS